jgi:hypothetical protein
MRAARFWFSALWLSTSGCASSNMKIPGNVADAPTVQVRGHTEASRLRPPALKLDGWMAQNVVRSANRPTGRGATQWSREPTETQLHFDLLEGSTALHADCTERVHRTAMGFGKQENNLECTCREAGADRMRLTLVNGKGSAILGAGTEFRITPILQADSGKKQHRALGYLFEGSAGQGAGAVEVTERSRAFRPPQLPESERPALLCAYASLLLYRPSG